MDFNIGDIISIASIDEADWFVQYYNVGLNWSGAVVDVDNESNIVTVEFLVNYITRTVRLPKHCLKVESKAPINQNKVSQTLSERGNRYGDFVGFSELSQFLKEAIGNGTGWGVMKPYQREAMEMILHKITRIANGDPNYADSWHDIAGYATLVADQLDG